MTEKKPDSDRIAALETSIQHLAAQVSGLTQDVQNFVRSSGTNWGVIGTWSTVLVTIIGGLGYLAITPLQDNQQRLTILIDKQIQEFNEHITDGHPRRVEQKADNNSEDIVRLDETLQREMRLLDQNTIRQVEALDKRLQTEMRLIQEKRDERVDSTRDRLKTVEKWQYEREGIPEKTESLEKRVLRLEDWHKKVEGIAEQLRAIERAVFKEGQNNE